MRRGSRHGTRVVSGNGQSGDSLAKQATCRSAWMQGWHDACPMRLPPWRSRDINGMYYRTFYHSPADRLAAETPRASHARPSSAAAFSATIHDVAPATLERCQRLIGCIDAVGRVPMTLLIVPRYHHERSTPRFERWVESRLRNGDDLAFH